MSDTPQTALPSSPLRPGAPPLDDTLPGMQLGDYVVEKAIAWGGMGIVYRAVHPLIGRKVAVKVLRPNFAADPEQASRFLNEAQAISAIKHRGIIDIIGFGKLPDGRQYMVMEYLEGETLEEVMKREGAMDPARALAIIDEVLDALSAAHQAGVVHRDLKPSNVYITQQSNGSRYVKLVDFGLARRASVEDLNKLSGKASVMAGTPEYLSPEQVKGLAATPRTDLYGLGVMFFEMITGQLPFVSDSVLELLNAHRIAVAPRARTFVGRLPQSLDDLIASCLEKLPEHRPASADIARQTVQRIMRELREDTTRITSVPSFAFTPPVAEKHTVRMEPKSRATLPPEGPRSSASPTAPDLSAPRVPKWVWAAVAGGVLVGGGVLVFRPGAPLQVEAVPLEPPPAPLERVPSKEVMVEPAPVVVPKDPPRKETPRRDPVRKEAPHGVAPAKGPPEACAGGQPTWKPLLTQALDTEDQAYTSKISGQVDPSADKELGALRGKIKTVKTLADCLQVMKGLEGWHKKYLN